MEFLEDNSSKKVEHLFALHRVLSASENYLADLDPDSSLAIARARESIYSLTQVYMAGGEYDFEGAEGKFKKAISILEKLPKSDDTKIIDTLVPMLEILRIEFACSN